MSREALEPDFGVVLRDARHQLGERDRPLCTGPRRPEPRQRFQKVLSDAGPSRPQAALSPVGTQPISRRRNAFTALPAMLSGSEVTTCTAWAAVGSSKP